MAFYDSQEDPFGSNVDNAEAFEFGARNNASGRWDPTHNKKLTTPHVATYIKKHQPNPGGAAVFAYSTYGTPPFLPIGSSIMVQRMPKPCEPAVPFSIHGDVNTQLGGLITGNNYSQPLYDPATNTYGGIDLSDDEE